MKRRILRNNLIVLVVALVLALLFYAFVFDRSLTNAHDRSMLNSAHLMAAGLHTDHDYQVQVEEYAKDSGGLTVCLVSHTGRLMADSTGQLDPSLNYLAYEEFQEAQANGVGNAIRSAEPLGDKVVYSAVRTPGGEYLRVSKQYEGFWAGLRNLLPPMLVITTAALLAAIALSERLTHSILQPLREFSDRIDQVMEGGEELDADQYQYEELQAMAVKINRLSGEVEEGILRVGREHTRIETILASMNEGFVMSDEDDNLILINAAACRILGCDYPPRGNNLLYATRHLPVLQTVEKVKKEGGKASIELKGPDGGIYEVSVSSVATHDEQGNWRGAVVMLLGDVTDRRKAIEMRQNFFQSASHELKTPITSIRGFAELLVTTPMDMARQKEFIERILKESQRMDSLIEDILMISRLESGDIHFEMLDIDFYEVVRECCDDARPMAVENDVDIYFEGEHCVFKGSHRQLAELAGNLITNAVKYNRHGGYVEVKLRVLSGAPVLTVFNTGDAIPHNEIKRIFERFFRLDSGRSKAVGGTGLGLAIVKHVATQYGAEVQVIPKKGMGNVFKVTFPAGILVQPPRAAGEQTVTTQGET